MIKGMAHVCLATPDLSAAERFYGEVLGLSKVFSFFRDDKRVGCYLALPDGTFIEIFERADTDREARGPIQHICLEVEAIETVRERLLAHGCEATPAKLGADGSWQTWTTDPAGVRIEFHQYTDASAQRTHRDCQLP